jgi:hypothetical protein
VQHTPLTVPTGLQMLAKAQVQLVAKLTLCTLRHIVLEALAAR